MNKQLTPIPENSKPDYTEAAIPIPKTTGLDSFAEALNGPNGKVISITFGIVTMSFFGLIAFGMLNDYAPSLKIGNMSLSLARC